MVSHSKETLINYKPKITFPTLIPLYLPPILCFSLPIFFYIVRTTFGTRYFFILLLGSFFRFHFSEWNLGLFGVP